MIQDVKIKILKTNPDERGTLTEILRKDDPIYQGFGQVYVTRNYPGVVRAWHCHEKQTDFFSIISGMAKIVLYDAREDSSTYKEINEFFVGDDNRILLSIPPRVYHGFKTIGDQSALLINFPTEVYNPKEPDEIRIPYNSSQIPYDWDIKMK